MGFWSFGTIAPLLQNVVAASVNAFSPTGLAYVSVLVWRNVLQVDVSALVNSWTL